MAMIGPPGPHGSSRIRRSAWRIRCCWDRSWRSRLPPSTRRPWPPLNPISSGNRSACAPGPGPVSPRPGSGLGNLGAVADGWDRDVGCLASGAWGGSGGSHGGAGRSRHPGRHVGGAGVMGAATRLVPGSGQRSRSPRHRRGHGGGRHPSPQAAGTRGAIRGPSGLGRLPASAANRRRAVPAVRTVAAWSFLAAAPDGSARVPGGVDATGP